MRSYKGYTSEQRSASLRKTNKAIMNSEIPLAEKCQFCGQTEGVIEYHNEDYSHHTKNLWSVCKRCHMVYHAGDPEFASPIATATMKEYFRRVKNGERFQPLRTPHPGFWAAIKAGRLLEADYPQSMEGWEMSNNQKRIRAERIKRAKKLTLF